MPAICFCLFLYREKNRKNIEIETYQAKRIKSDIKRKKIAVNIEQIRELIGD